MSQGIEDAIAKIEEKNKKIEELELKIDTESRILSEKVVYIIILMFYFLLIPNIPF